MDQPGFKWCEVCKDQIPDAFTDHSEKHEAIAERNDRAWTVGAFWAICVTFGALAGIIAHNFNVIL